MVLTVQGLQVVAPLFVPPLVKLVCCRHLKAVDLGYQNGIPRDLPLPL